jgi:hypothetical protein
VIVVLGAAIAMSGCHRLPSWRPQPSDGGASGALVRVPRDAARFEIDSVTDSTATFRIREARWVRPGLQSYVVDPRQRDALVARLRVVARDSGSATALVTGQVARVRADHFLLVVRPAQPWWASPRFWGGVLAGGALGAGGILILR